MTLTYLLDTLPLNSSKMVGDAVGIVLNFFMESIKIAETKVVAADRKAASTKVLVCKAEGRALKVELAFQQAKRHANIVMDDARSLAKKLK